MHSSTRVPQFPLPMKGRQSEIPLETREEPKDAVYQTQDDSPLKETPKFQISPKQNKLRSQVKTRSVDDVVQEHKQTIKRSTSDRLNPINPMKSPINGDFSLANQNAAFGLKPSFQAENTGNYGYERKNPYQNTIAEEKDEISTYPSNPHSSDAPHSNQNVSNNRENVGVSSPIGFENEVPCLAPRKVSLKEQQLEETLTPRLRLRAREEEPIYENFPFRVANQSDSYLHDEVLRLRRIISTLGNFQKIEESSRKIGCQNNTILELELKNEKLKRDNRILRTDSDQKEQIVKSTLFSLDQQIEHNKHLQSKISALHAMSYATKPPHRYQEGNRYHEQNNNQFRNEPQPMEPRRLSYRSENTYHPANLAPSAAQSELRIPRSLPNGGIANIPNIPLNPHLNGGYPASHDPKGSR